MEEEKERITIFIDGSNLYHKLKDLKVQKTTDFNYKGLCDFLVRKRRVQSYNYYVGAIRVPEHDLRGTGLRKSQQKLFANLENQCFIIKRGYMMENNGKYHEKGVDVKIATDMLIGAYEDYYDTALLISSDTDLIPAIEQVKKRGKQVEYIGFSHLPSIALQKASSLPRLLIRPDIEPFIYTC